MAQQSIYAGGNFHVRKPDYMTVLVEGQPNNIGGKIFF